MNWIEMLSIAAEAFVIGFVASYFMDYLRNRRGWRTFVRGGQTCRIKTTPPEASDEYARKLVNDGWEEL